MLLTRNIERDRVTYIINNKKQFNPLNILDNEIISKCKEFAYAMSFGSQGQHRANRTGGKNERLNSEIFCDAFNGKLGEFAIKQYFKSQNINLPEPDLDVYGLGEWDDTDFFYNGYCIAVKTTKHFGNLLLLEYGDWDFEGRYIPNYDSPSKGKYDAIILVRINSDIDARFRNERKYFSDTLTEKELNQIFNGFSCAFDIPGYANIPLLQYIIAHNQIIEQDSYLGQRTRMDATNYYIQSGNLLDINRLIYQLSNNVNTLGNVIPIV